MLNKPQDPVTLYGPNGQTKRIPAVDAAGWLAHGWSMTPVEKQEVIEPTGSVSVENQDPPTPPKGRSKTNSEQLPVTSN